MSVYFNNQTGRLAIYNNLESTYTYMYGQDDGVLVKDVYMVVSPEDLGYVLIGSF